MNSQLTVPSEAAQNMEAARMLWEISEKLTGMSHESW